jgi:hypothetical protein
MSQDLSVRKPTQSAQRAADALLRSLGGSSVKLRIPGRPCAGSCDQIGLGVGTYEDLLLTPALFRRTRATMAAGTECVWELLLSATVVQVQVSAAQLDSADELFAEAVSVLVGTQTFTIEAISASEVFGQVYLYRLLLREASPKAQ